MAGDQAVANLKKAIDEVLVYNKDSLTKRDKWGEITFEEASRDFERIYTLLSYLQLLPLEYLTDETVEGIKREASSLKEVFDRIDKFSISTPNPPEARKQLVEQVHRQADSLYRVASQWIPFLAYQKGDVAENINRLSGAVSDATKLIEETKGTIGGKSKEIDGIITKAREASAAAGAAVFTQDFLREADDRREQAKTWLNSTGILAAVTVGVALAMWAWPAAGLDPGQIWQKVATKLAILGLLISATAWCGRIYKAHMHQCTVSKHKALGLQTFQAFSSAASDAATKDAVLLETTRSIFVTAPTGFIDQSTPDSDIKVLEIIRSFLPKSSSQ